MVRTLLASFAIPTFLLRDPSHQGAWARPAALEDPLEQGESQIKRQEQRVRRVRPVYYKKIALRYRSRLHHISTKSQNVRDLDQRKIRRKCINY